MTGHGDMIVAARRSASMTQEELCSHLGITQAALSRYENDLREPDQTMLNRISEALGLSSAFMQHNFRLQGALAADAHMRRQKTTKPSDWKRAESRLNMLRMHSSYLFEKVPMSPQSHVPTFDPEETTPADAARLVRAQWRMPVGPVRNLTRWLESSGILVVEEDLGTKRIDGLSQWAGPHPVVIINSSLPPDRKRHTLSHELGHLVLHNRFVDADMEDQANAFAAEFMAPEHFIKSSLRSVSLGKLVDLKMEWGLSMACLIERAHHLGVLPSVERQQLLKTMNSRGWRTKEPGNDRIPVESPQLASSVGIALSDAGLTPSEIAQMAGFQAVELDHWFAPPGPALRAL